MGLIKALVFKLYSWMQGHEGVSDAHHSKYTDAEVETLIAAHKFLKKNVSNDVTAETSFKSTVGLRYIKFLREAAGWMFATELMCGEIKSTTATYQQMMLLQTFPSVIATGTDTSKTIGYVKFMKPAAQNASYIVFGVLNTTPAPVIPLELHYNKVDVKVNLYIQSVKSGATQAGAGAAAKEVWKTSAHATLPDNVLMIGV